MEKRGSNKKGFILIILISFFPFLIKSQTAEEIITAQSIIKIKEKGM